MRVRGRIVIGAGALALLPSLAGAAQPHDDAVEEAKTSARAWLLLLDGRQYDESWEAAGELLRMAVDRKEWTAKLSVTLGPLGKMQSREVRSARHANTLPGAPKGEYVVLEFDTSFEVQKRAVETVTLRRQPDGLWRVSGYYIR
jgi:hypothetical protein